MSWGVHRNPIAHIDTTPERVLEGLTNYRWDPDKQTFVKCEAAPWARPEPEEDTPKIQYLEWDSFQRDFVPWHPPAADEGEEEK